MTSVFLFEREGLTSLLHFTAPPPLIQAGRTSAQCADSTAD